jgi:uncharacterized OB-fold protein
MSLERPLPELNGFAEAFWKGASEGALLIQKCRACEHFQHYARPFCLRCDSEDLEMVRSSGRGTILSYTVVHRTPYTDIATPYVVALIRLDENVTILSHIVEADFGRISCDKRVTVMFQPFRESVRLPAFTLEGQAAP